MLIAISKPVFVKSSADAGDGVAKAMDKMLGFVSKCTEPVLNEEYIITFLYSFTKHDHCALMFTLKFILIYRNVWINNTNYISSCTIY